MVTLFEDPFFSTLDKVFETRRVGDNPKTTIKKNNDGYILLTPVPGLTKDDLKVISKDGVLKISFEREIKDNTLFFVSNFSKSYYLPENTLDSEIKAKVENGVLEIKIPYDDKKMIERIVSIE